MKVEGQCDCGAVQLTLGYAPTDINDCQCSHCRKRGVLWAYYSPGDVAVQGPTSHYLRGSKQIVFHFCTTCGCTTHWTAVDTKRDHMGVNTRLLPPEAVAGATTRKSPGPK